MQQATSGSGHTVMADGLTGHGKSSSSHSLPCGKSSSQFFGTLGLGTSVEEEICFHCDNQAVLEIWNKGSTKDPPVMGLVRKTFLTVARINFTITIDRTDNCIADVLSRLQVQRFQQLATAASRAETFPPLP